MSKEENQKLIEELTNKTDMPLFERDIEGRLGGGMPQTIGYTSVFIGGATGIRQLTALGIPREFITVRQCWDDVNAGRSRYPKRKAVAKIEFPHHTSRDDQTCICGCMEIGSQIVKNAQDAGFKAQMGGRTHWLDR